MRRQVLAGEARPRLRLAEWVRALREGTAPRDAYVFHNVSAGPVARALAPLHALWRNVSLALPAAKPPAAPPTAPPALPPLTRLGVGGSGSGAPFHDHDVIALNLAFAGRKRWLITRPCRPTCRIPSMGGVALYHSEVLLSQARLPGAALRVLGGHAGDGTTWDCTQRPGEAVFVPALFLHATINLDESVAVAVQCDDGADARAGLTSHLNALIVHANGAAATPGPCGGTSWESPFRGDLGTEEAMQMLVRLPNNFRGDPGVYLNSPARDGHVPVDVAVRFSSTRVAKALVAHGARFLPRHAADAQRHGHAALAAFIDKLLVAENLRTEKDE